LQGFCEISSLFILFIIGGKAPLSPQNPLGTPMVSVTSIRTLVQKNEIVAYLRNGLLPTFKYPQLKRKFLEKAAKFELRGDTLYVKIGSSHLIAVCQEDTDEISDILNKVHGSGHIGMFFSDVLLLGRNRMLPEISRRYSGIRKCEV
jgi:hypothetical protein